MAIGKISEELKSAQDYLFNDTTVTANATLTGDANLVGGAQAALEIVVNVGSVAIALADTKVLTISLTGSDTETGSFTALQTLYTKTASGATTLAAGTELARYVVKPSGPLYVKAVAVNNDATLTGKIEAYIRYIAR